MKQLKLYPYGFILTNNKNVNVPEYYDEIKLTTELLYSFDSSIKPALYQSNDDFLLIHGHFTHVGRDEIIENKDLPKFLLTLYKEEEHKFLDVLDFIGGRYVIIVGSKSEVRIYPDATACRSVYYSTDSNNIASHVNLLSDNCSSIKNTSFIDNPKLTHSLNFTPYENIKSLLPNIYLEFSSMKTKRFFPRRKNIYSNLNAEERFALVERLWKKQLEYYSKNFENIVFSLTAGQDSRVSLALAKEYKENMSFFTYTVIPENSSAKDYFSESLSMDEIVVKQILEDIPLKHQFFRFKRNEDVLTLDEKRIVSRNTILSHGRYLIKYYKDAFPFDNVMHVRATSLEIGRAVYMPVNKPNNLDSVSDIFLKQVSRGKNGLSNKELLNIFEDGIKSFYYTDLYGYHLLDMYYWENRLGRWFPEVLNETDSAFDTFLPYNMRAIIDISLSFDIDQRRSNFMFTEIINRNYPLLNFYGKNEVENLYEKNRDCEAVTDTFIESFVVNALTKAEGDKFSVNNLIYIPRDYLSPDNFSEASLTFETKIGVAKLVLLNSYFSEKGNGFIQYEIYKNNKLLLIEDISRIDFEVNITVYNLIKGDRIFIKVRALKECKFKSWEVASTLKILDYKEVFTEKKFKKEIISDSPFASLY